MRILLVEDDKQHVEFIRRGLKQEGYCIDHASDGEYGLILALSTSYDLFIFDLMLPSMDGLSLIRNIRSKGITTPILILSALSTVDDRVQGLRSGGDDYLIDIQRHEVFRNEIRIDLQPKEYILLEYMMRNTCHVLSKTMIMEHVWDYNFDPLTNVVEVRISKLREKIDRGFDCKLIHTIRGVGYVLEKRVNQEVHND